MTLILLIVIGGLMHAARSFAPQPGLGTGPGATTLAAGFLLLSALLMGNLFRDLGLPKLTGYLMAGILTGPYVLGLVEDSMVVNLRIFNGVAIALIALTAGTEMEIRIMRPLLRTIGWITGIGVVGTIVLLSATVYLARGLLSFTAEMSAVQLAAVAAVLGVTMAAQSPAVAVALRNETEADGPLTRTVLGVVVVSDLVIILLFALTSSIAKILIGAGSAEALSAGMLIWEVVGSGIAGVLIGILIAAFLRAVQGAGGLFVVTSGFLLAEVGQRIGFDPLLVALAAGVFIRNFTGLGDRLHAEIEKASLPVYVGFFAVAGATIHVDALVAVGVPAALFVAVRGFGFLAGTRIATEVAESPEPVKRYAGFGLLPQAGLALALALLFTRTFPSFGPEASALVFGVVALNEVIAPILYRYALLKSGEAGQKAAAEAKPVFGSAGEAPAPGQA
jgi:Kef-type K+ transport system membrane component KefB